MYKKTLTFCLALVLTLSLVVPALSTSTVFSDFDPINNYYTEVMEMVDKGYINGYEDGTFKPEKLVTRAEYVKIKGINPTKRAEDFTDVSKSDWSYIYVIYSGSNGIGNNNFGPNQNITIQEELTFLWQDAGKPESYLSEDLKNQIDIQAADWARPAIYWAFENQIIQNSDKQTNYVSDLRLTEYATRIETVIFTYKSKTLNGELEYYPTLPKLPPNPLPGKLFTSDEIVTTKERLLEVIEQVVNTFRIVVNIKIINESILIPLEELKKTYGYNQINQTYTYMEDNQLMLHYDLIHSIYGHFSYAHKYNDTSYLSDNDKELYEKAIEIVNNIMKPGMSDYEKAVAAHDYICKNFTRSSEPAVITYRPFITNIAISQEYAATFNALMLLSDVTCMQIRGKRSDFSFNWNLIKLDGNWYHLDIDADDRWHDFHDEMTYYRSFLSDDEMMSFGYTWDTDNYPAALNSYE